MNEKIKAKNAAYMQLIKVSEKIMPACIVAIVLTVVAACADMLFMIGGFENLLYVFDFLDDYQLGFMIIIRIVIYVALILIEVLLCTFATLINNFASTIFKYDDMQ